MGNDLGVERREIRCQHQLADIVQDAGGKGEFRVVAGGAGQFAGGQCRADTMPEISRLIESRAEIGPESAIDTHRQHHAAHGAEAENDDGFIDRTDAALQAVKG